MRPIPPSVLPSMAMQSPPLSALPLELLAEIAFEVAVLRTPHGPPADIIPLLLSCKAIHSSLAFDHCASLYARIYRSNFDIRAPRRRLADDNLLVRNCAAQLKKCCVALKRIRRGDLDSETLEADLWTAWLMALENDGKNGGQLDWARLDDLLRRFILTRLWDGREAHSDWPTESAINALVVWLFWYRLSPDKLEALTNEQRSSIIDLVRPYALIVPRYPPFHAPDCHFTLPMRPDRALLTDWQKIPTPHGFWPVYRTPDGSIHHIEHYGCELEITEPLLALGAQLLFFTLYWQPLILSPSLPVDRAQALALGLTGVCETQADLLEYNSSSPVRLVDNDPEWYHRLTDEERAREDATGWTKTLRSPSAKWECDFNRLIGCVDPYNIRPKTVTYAYGTLTGLWKGLHLSPHPEQYFAAVRSTRFPADFSAENPHLFMHPVYLQLREHHCVSPARLSPCGGNPNDNDDGINHAWLPSSFDVREANGTVRLRDLQRPNEPPAVYETYVEGKRNSHNPETCNHCVAKQKADESVLAAKVERNKRKAARKPPPPRAPDAPSSSTDHADSDGDHALQDTRATATAALGQDVDEVVDELFTEGSSSSSEDDDDQDDCRREITCTGVQDIIITGETLPRHGDAWYHFQCYGRIRPWDGLVALVRVPIDPPGRFGVYIFRGYIVGGCNLVGSWRVRTGNTRAVPLEGPFIMSRVE